MADKSITLSQSENSSSAGRKFTAYVTGCDTKHYEGSWAVPDSYDGIGVSIDSTYITLWNANSTDSDVKAIFTWTSSKLSTCQKSLEVTASKADCPGFNAVFVVVFNDDSDGLLESVSGNVQLNFNIINDSIEHPVLGTIGNIAINSTGEFSDEPETIIAGCTNTVDNVKFIFDNVDLTCSFSGNIVNFTVSGGIEYRLGDSGSYTTLSSVNNYNVSILDSSVTIGKCSIEDTSLWSMMDGSKTLYLKHVITMNYDKPSYKWYYSDDGFASSVVETTDVSITIYENSFGSWGNGGFAAIFCCYKNPIESSNSDYCSGTYTIQNTKTINVGGKTWRLSDLRYDLNNGICFTTPSTLVTSLAKLTSSFEYNITGTIEAKDLTLPVSITYKKVGEKITSTINFKIDFYNNLDGEYDGDLHGDATCTVDGNTWTSGLTCSPGYWDGDTSGNYTLSGEKGKSYTVTFTISVAIDYYGKCPNIEFSDSSNIDIGVVGDNIMCPEKNKSYTNTYSTTITLDNDGTSYTAHIIVECNR